MYKWIKGENGEYVRGDLPKRAVKERSVVTPEVVVIPEVKVVPGVRRIMRKMAPCPKPTRPGGGGSIPDWQAIKKRILERDNYACRVCGKDNVEAKLHVHHVDRNRANNGNANLVTLCYVCHSHVHMEDYIPDDPFYPPPWGVLE